MAKVNVTASEFPNIVVCFLLDKLMNPDKVIPDNEEFNKYMNKMKLKGMQPLSLNYYLDMSSLYRVYYKRIKGVFDDKSNSQMIIQIYPNKETKDDVEKKESMVKKVIRKLLKKESITKGEYNLLVEQFKEE